MPGIYRCRGTAERTDLHPWDAFCVAFRLKPPRLCFISLTYLDLHLYIHVDLRRDLRVCKHAHGTLLYAGAK